MAIYFFMVDVFRGHELFKIFDLLCRGFPRALHDISAEQLTSLATPGLLLSTSEGPHGPTGPEASVATEPSIR